VQHPYESYFTGHGERELVGAASRDRVWGIGFSEGRAEEFRGAWGENLGVIRGRGEWELREGLGEWNSDEGEEAE